jgi:hypothetical protein
MRTQAKRVDTNHTRATISATACNNTTTDAQAPWAHCGLICTAPRFRILRATAHVRAICCHIHAQTGIAWARQAPVQPQPAGSGQNVSCQCRPATCARRTPLEFSPWATATTAMEAPGCRQAARTSVLNSGECSPKKSCNCREGFALGYTVSFSQRDLI